MLCSAQRPHDRTKVRNNTNSPAQEASLPHFRRKPPDGQSAASLHTPFYHCLSPRPVSCLAAHTHKLCRATYGAAALTDENLLGRQLAALPLRECECPNQLGPKS